MHLLKALDLRPSKCLLCILACAACFSLQGQGPELELEPQQRQEQQQRKADSLEKQKAHDSERQYADSLERQYIDSLRAYLQGLEAEQRDSLRRAFLQTISFENLSFTPDELAKVEALLQLSDSGSQPHDDRNLPKMFARPPEDPALSRPRWENPSPAVFRSLPDDWKDIDPFKHRGGMVPNVPPKSKLTPHNYTRFYVGAPGYYGTLVQLGYVKEAWTGLDSLQNNEIEIDLSHLLPKSPYGMSREWLKAAGRAKTLLILLLMFF